MERIVGRPLLPTEYVHHRDGDGLNNSPDNLELVSPAKHTAYHRLGRTRWPVAEALRLRQNGATIDALAARYGLAAASVLKAFRRRGISTTDRRWGRTKWPLEEAASLYRAGESLAAIGRRFGVSAPSIRKTFRKKGVM